MRSQRDAGPTPLLKKRGSEILETTTNTEFFTKTITQTNIDGVQVSTSTDTVFFCEPTSTKVTTPTTSGSSSGTSVPAEGITTTVRIYRSLSMKILLTIYSERTSINNHPLSGDSFISGQSDH